MDDLLKELKKERDVALIHQHDNDYSLGYLNGIEKAIELLKNCYTPVVMPSSYMPYDLDLPNGLYKIFTDKNREGVAEMFYGDWTEYNFIPLPDEKVIGFKDY